METSFRLKALKAALIIIGLFFVFGLVPMMLLFPESWGWIPSQAKYEQMIQGVYITLGIFLILAAKDPLQNKSLIWFTVWSSLVHASIMLVQAFVYPEEHPNLHGDIPGLYGVALVLGLLMPRR